ncbi:carboxylate-amine ligase [Nocardioides lianchengensis]|uniref:Putative glutamate--cysteine ligase 2 n=1 Tax=Nocardioides lianchengensis TaxID=1045774 RepID=A0A1G6R243_9ACTN|nr:glutamate--cysteine ligase [Nocardioides lianchengensis]NYG10399.1 carboxylate-amine ligase [Nocardioides lianchengensis]SDC98618.1 carboxylate-amine ligase [Nocardioides lianchengensis]
MSGSGTPRTIGLEEELLLVDPATRRVTSRATQVLKDFHDRGPERTRATDDLDPELFRHQLETRTDPSASTVDQLDQVRAARRTAGEAAAAGGLAVAACGIVPSALEEAVVSPGDRYRAIVDTFGAVALTGGTCGMHVHVDIASDAEGVGVLDRIGPWLPVLLAVSANSPIHDGRDTSYASWRSQVWGRWPSAGPTEQFGSVEGYRAACAALIATGAALDEGMLYLDARLAAHQPTLEVRVADVCTDPLDTVLVAALTRALVETLARDHAAGTPVPPWRAEALRAAQWRAARYGVSGRLVHPEQRGLAPVAEVLAALVERVRPALEEAGDADLVRDGVRRVLAAGGSSRQRAAHERTGSVDGVVDDLLARTRASWEGA